MFPDLRADRAVGPLVPSVIPGTNAHLVEKVRHLGYLDGTVVDVTYGQGGWWSRWRPAGLVAHDLAVDAVDFTALPYDADAFDTVCYDPPYIPAGGDTTSTAPQFQARYGITGGRSQAELDAMVFAGLAETLRVGRRFVLVKCMDYVNGGSFHPMSYRVAARAMELGARMHDELVHHAGPGPGGHNIVDQVRARRCHSKLLVFVP